MHVLKGRGRSLSYCVPCVLIVCVGEPLVARVMGIGCEEHEDASMGGHSQPLHPPVASEVLVEALHWEGGTVMTSKA